MGTSDKREDRLRSRFKKGVDKSVGEYVASIPFDWRLYRQDVDGSIAHAQMLAKQGIISEGDADLITSSLVSIRNEIEQGKLEFKPELEDIHMAIENRLFEVLGDVAGKLHTARSRNDQVALDLRLFVKEAISETVGKVRGFQRVLLDVAEANKNVIVPG